MGRVGDWGGGGVLDRENGEVVSECVKASYIVFIPFLNHA